MELWSLGGAATVFARFCIILCVHSSAEQRMDTLLPQLMKAAGVTEELKARDQMAWVGLMNNCRARVEYQVLRAGSQAINA